MKIRLFCVALVALSFGCGEVEGAAACGACGEPAVVGALSEPGLTELSGLTASAVFPDVLYAHNDSGDAGRFFALTGDGEALAVFSVMGAKNVDWEEMGRGPCAAGSCIFIADTGDNELERTGYSLYRVPEPAEIGSGPRKIAGERIDFTYPDGPHDAEAMLVHPVSGVVTIVTKVESGPAQVYALPSSLAPGQVHVSERVGELAPPRGDDRFTGGAVHPDGTAVLLRTRGKLFRYAMDPEQSVAEALQGAPCELPVGQETMGEAVTWSASGAEIVTIGEGAGAAVHESSCEA